MSADKPFSQRVLSVFYHIPPFSIAHRRSLRRRAIDSLEHDPIIEVHDLGLLDVYGYAYRHVDGLIPKGKLCAVLGCKGSGSTALLLGLAGHMPPNLGTLDVCGYSFPQDARQIRERVGLGVFAGVNELPEHLPCDSVVSAELALYGKAAGRKAAAAYMQERGCGDLARKKVGQLSRLEFLRLSALLAQVNEAQIIVLDAVDLGLSARDSQRLMEELRESCQLRGITVLLGCIGYETARHADAVLLLDEDSREQWEADPQHPVCAGGVNAQASDDLRSEGAAKLRLWGMARAQRRQREARTGEAEDRLHAADLNMNRAELEERLRAGNRELRRRLWSHRPLRALRLSMTDLRNSLGSLPMLLTVATIALIPVIYAGLYLLAFQDPYGNLDKIPVAVVNEDAGCEFEGQRLALGERLVEEMQQVEGLGWNFVDAQEASEGLALGRYYLTISIPDDFSDCVASAASQQPRKARLEVEYNEALNLTASVIGQNALKQLQGRLNQSLSQEYFSILLGRIASAATQLQDAVDGSQQLSEGLLQLRDGSSLLRQNLDLLRDYGNQARSSAQRAQSDLDEILAILPQLDSELEQSLKDECARLGHELQEDELALIRSGQLSIEELLSEDLPVDKPLSAEERSALLAMEDLLQLLSRLSEVDVDEAAALANQLIDGLNQLADGSEQLEEGLGTAQEGAQQLYEGLDEGVQQMQLSDGQLETMPTMMSAAVQIEESYVSKVANYGEGLSPYFISLGLWVGALIMSFIYRPFNGRALRSGASPHLAAATGSLPLCALATVQALVLAFVIHVIMGVNVAHPLAYYLLSILTACVFALIIQFLVGALKLPGKLIAIIVLMLQLTSVGGTFPLETSPEIFQNIGPFMPMYYSVLGLRQAISGCSDMLLIQSFVALIGFAVLLFYACCMVARLKRSMHINDLHPIFKLQD